MTNQGHTSPGSVSPRPATRLPACSCPSLYLLSSCAQCVLKLETAMVSGCGHCYCAECMGGLCSVHIGEGSLENVRCPDCKAKLDVEE